MRAPVARRYARLLAYGRLGLGVTALVAPRLPATFWVGRADASRPSAQLLSRALGARDVALGLGPVLALRHGTPVRGWVEAGGLADAGDLVATLLAWRHVPRRARPVMVGIIAGSMAASRVLAPSLD
ncbi:MAG: hypothetical protein ACRD0N_02595 [Acidimicrobiales bacterium]